MLSFGIVTIIIIVLKAMPRQYDIITVMDWNIELPVYYYDYESFNSHAKTYITEKKSRLIMMIMKLDK